jgi:hypothetical protein
MFGGAKAAYEIPMMDRHLRITGRALTDLNISNNNLFLVLAGAEIPLYGVKLGSAPVAQAPVTIDLPMKLVHFFLCALPAVVWPLVPTPITIEPIAVWTLSGAAGVR